MGACPELSIFTNLNTTNSILVNNADPNAVYTNGNGEFTYEQLAVFEKNFSDGIIEDGTNNALDNAISLYGQQEFYDGVNNFNNYLKPDGQFGSVLFGNSNNATNENYNVVYRTLESGRQVTPFEFAQFINDFNYTPTTVINSNSTNVLINLNSFYNGPWSSSIMGGFCKTFATAAAAVVLFNNLGNLTKGALDALNKIKGFDPESIIKAAIDKVTNIANIKALKENILKIIDSKVKDVVNAVKNFDITQVAQNIANGIGKKVAKIKESILSFFEGDFVQKIKDKVSGLIDYATNLFQNPSLETIQLMISRFCSMAAIVEQVIEDTKKPLDQFVDKYARLYGLMQTSSNLVTARAIESGAIRFSDRRRLELINKINETNYGPVKTNGGNDSSSSETDYEIPDISGRLQRPVTDRERMALPTWEDLINNTDPRIWHAGTGETYYYYSEEQKNGPGPCQIWEEMDQDVRCLILRVQTRWGKKLRLRSGFRGNGANDWLRRKNGSKVAKNSYHKKGMAADLSWSGFSLTQARQFKKIAIEEGFNGVGIYSSFIHIDTRDPKAAWYWYG